VTYQPRATPWEPVARSVEPCKGVTIGISDSLDNLALVQLNRQKNVESTITPVKTIIYVNYHAFPKDTVTY
jgi:hypothetical protein